MTIKSDAWLRRMAAEGMIEPFLPELVREAEGRRIISAGLSSYGYDMRLADDGFRIFTSAHAVEIDPKRFDAQYSLIEPELRTSEDGARYYLLPPHHYGLGVTVETFRMPRNVTGIALGKSTYARAGLLVNTTPLEAGWTGRLVVEIANLANLPLRVYVNEGIGQILFFESDEDCSVSYDDRGGKYQGQTGLTYAKV
ncbi:MAG: dCTP deaminase [Pyrinomonadaceae bacterium]|jgi:dCTP deaminase